ncbi:SseB family protein [Nocardioides lijunqiniae]|uniref:SseB family protein n=1 Tax=Nocardioides lijunqiniae TaxID=2760832 RepID=UPI0018775192|nr:SseB family protein [Nocardioides lijunqiniae]
MELVDNVPLRTALAAFAADSNQATYLEVLRHLFQGELLLDATASDLQVDGGTIAAGSTLRFAGGTGPDGATALFAFTRQEEVARMHPAGTHVQTVGQPAASVLELTASQGHGWLYLDPAGPTCAINLAEASFVLRNPRNDAVKDAIPHGSSAVVDALAGGGVLFYAVDEQPDGARARTTAMPDGSPARLAFTSPAEVVVRAPDDAFVAVDVARVVEEALAEPFVALVLNPAGPWVALRPDELTAVRAGLASA